MKSSRYFIAKKENTMNGGDVLKYLDIKGKTVTTTAGKNLGKVLDLFINPKQGKIHGLIVVNNNVIRNVHYIPFRNFRIQRGVVIVNGIFIKVKKSYLRKNKNSSMQNYINKEIYSRTGEKLGVLIDCIFDLTSARILALAASNGFFEDIFEGRKIYITKHDELSLKEKNIVIKEGCCNINSSAFYKKYLRE
jgi:uncharacterized protein YrrD